MHKHVTNVMDPLCRTALRKVSKEDVDQLSVMLDDRNWKQINSVLGLRRHLKEYGLLRRIVLSIWLAVIYLADKESYHSTVHELQRAKEL
jgi:hypothetical protein